MRQAAAEFGRCKVQWDLRYGESDRYGYPRCLSITKKGNHCKNPTVDGEFCARHLAARASEPKQRAMRPWQSKECLGDWHPSTWVRILCIHLTCHRQNGADMLDSPELHG